MLTLIQLTESLIQFFAYYKIPSIALERFTYANTVSRKKNYNLLEIPLHRPTEYTLHEIHLNYAKQENLVISVSKTSPAPGLLISLIAL